MAVKGRFTQRKDDVSTASSDVMMRTHLDTSLWCRLLFLLGLTGAMRAGRAQAG